MPRDFDDNDFPLAYLISFRTYGTWLHGDERGSMDRKHNVYGTPKIAPNSALNRSDKAQLGHPPVSLDARQRPVVEGAVREVCENRRYTLRAINVRTNHLHSVVTAMVKPEPILEAFKAYATRKLRRAGLLAPGVKPWARGGSRRYLWKERHVERAIEYVLFYQGNDLFRIEDEEE
jgi:REP element-mobilizing transposase RayT